MMMKMILINLMIELITLGLMKKEKKTKKKIKILELLFLWFSYLKTKLIFTKEMNNKIEIELLYF